MKCELWVLLSLVKEVHSNVSPKMEDKSFKKCHQIYLDFFPWETNSPHFQVHWQLFINEILFGCSIFFQWKRNSGSCNFFLSLSLDEYFIAPEPRGYYLYAYKIPASNLENWIDFLRLNPLQSNSIPNEHLAHLHWI